VSRNRPHLRLRPTPLNPLFPDRAADAIKADWIERNILEDTVWVHGFPTLGFVSLKDNRLELIAVDPDFRGMGYGEKLIEHTPALKLYQRLGFKVVEEYDVWHGRDSETR
jgi:GNAT superfamily N-acetyltransferase